ncbi:MAG TPA: metallophosphoesterase [Polyangiaceae bacterium]|nr:metallophosphoesterase [Polyangiaceae bacterium]
MLHLSQDPREAERQMRAVIYYLTAFGYIDGEFDPSERQAVREQIGRLVEGRVELALGGEDPALRAELVGRWTRHFHEAFAEIDEGIKQTLDEPVAEGEDRLAFVLSRLKLRCYELFTGFDDDNRAALLAAVDEVMHADGVVDPREAAFRDEFAALLAAPLELGEHELEPVAAGEVVIGPRLALEPRQSNHPFFEPSEWHYPRDPDAFAERAAEDLALIESTLDRLERERAAGAGALGDAQDVAQFAGKDPFLDGHVYVLPPAPGKAYELLVLGDLHGCYSCLKAALLQADFFGKVRAFRDDPRKNPDVKLVLLGDYIDRGKFSYNGVLRTVMQLYTALPGHVFPLRGNHEYYVELNGRVYGAVRPSEALNDLVGIAPNEVFASFMRLFEALPNMLLFDRTLFVHAGIPRDETLASKWTGLASLNDPELRFQMLWSDPSSADYVPPDLQRGNARFPFGKKQFKSFLGRLGCTAMVRGHEKVVEGFRCVYDEPGSTLINVFSAGGRHNRDLPEQSSYRDVTPMALSIKHRDGVSELTPFAIDYERYNDPAYNAFFRTLAPARPPGGPRPARRPPFDRPSVMRPGRGPGEAA